MICRYCQNEIQDSSNYCSYCGGAVTGPQNTKRALGVMLGIFMINLILLILLFWGYWQADEKGYLTLFLAIAAVVVIAVRILAVREVLKMARIKRQAWAVFAVFLPITALMILRLQE